MFKKIIKFSPINGLEPASHAKDEYRSRTNYAPKKSSDETAAPAPGLISTPIAQLLLMIVDHVPFPLGAEATVMVIII